MTRSLLAFAVGLLAVVAARADIPAPPAAGKRFLPLQYKIETAADFPDYDFYTVADFGATKVPFGVKTPAVLYGTIVRRGMFVAVPKGAREKFKSDDEYRLALLVGTIPGQVGSDPLPLREEVAVADKRPGLVYTVALEKLDAKGRMVLKKSGKAPVVAAPPTPPGQPAADPSGEDSSAAPQPRGGGVVAGIALALALGFAGLRLARRRA